MKDLLLIFLFALVVSCAVTYIEVKYDQCHNRELRELEKEKLRLEIELKKRQLGL